jgi:hypothetical protein
MPSKELEMFIKSGEEVRRFVSSTLSRKLTRYYLVDEIQMDAITPPRIAEINRKAIVRKHASDSSDYLADILIPYYKGVSSTVLRRLIEVILDVLLNESMGTKSALLDPSLPYNLLPPNDDLTMVGNIHISDALGIARRGLSGDKYLALIEEQVHELATFTAMGCYCNKQVYLCPARIFEAANRLGVNKATLIEVVWLHEEMHAVTKGSIDGEMAEHIAQSMAAAIFDNLDKQEHLEVMVSLAARQPDAYQLFALDPNIGLIESRTKLQSLVKLNGSRGLDPTIIGSRNRVKFATLEYRGRQYQVGHLYQAAIKLAELMLAEDRNRFERDVFPLRREREYFTRSPQNPSHRVPGTDIFYQGSIEISTESVMKEMMAAFGVDPSLLVLSSGVR